MDLEDKMFGLYEEWFLDEFPDEYSCKDDFIEKIQNLQRFDDFKNKVIMFLKEY